MLYNIGRGFLNHQNKYNLHEKRGESTKRPPPLLYKLDYNFLSI